MTFSVNIKFYVIKINIACSYIQVFKFVGLHGDWVNCTMNKARWYGHWLNYCYPGYWVSAELCRSWAAFSTWRRKFTTWRREIYSRPSSCHLPTTSVFMESVLITATRGTRFVATLTCLKAVLLRFYLPQI